MGRQCILHLKFIWNEDYDHFAYTTQELDTSEASSAEILMCGGGDVYDGVYGGTLVGELDLSNTNSITAVAENANVKAGDGGVGGWDDFDYMGHGSNGGEMAGLKDDSGSWIVVCGGAGGRGGEAEYEDSTTDGGGGGGGAPGGAGGAGKGDATDGNPADTLPFLNCGGDGGDGASGSSTREEGYPGSDGYTIVQDSSIFSSYETDNQQTHHETYDDQLSNSRGTIYINEDSNHI